MDNTDELKAQLTPWEIHFTSSGNEYIPLYKYRGNLYRDLLTIKNNQIYVPSSDELNDPNESVINLAKIKNVHNDLFEEYNDVGFFSLSKSNKIDCLWTYYSNGHKGFCVEYDAKSLRDYFKQINIFKFILETNCDNNRICPDLEECIELMQQKISFLRNTQASKNGNWVHEQEVRFVLYKQGLVDIPNKMIKSIYIGARCPKQDEDLILRSLDGIGARFYKMKFKDDSFEMYSEPITI